MIINHFLLYRINKLDYDFLNRQIFSVVCPLRNHMTLLFVPSVLKRMQRWQVGWIRSIAKNAVCLFFFFFFQDKSHHIHWYFCFHVKMWKTEIKTILKYLCSRVGIIMLTGGSRTVVASKPDTLPTVICYENFDDCGTVQGLVPKVKGRLALIQGWNFVALFVFTFLCIA